MADSRLSAPTIPPREIVDWVGRNTVGARQFFSVVRERITQAYIGIQARRYGSLEAYQLEEAIREFKRSRRCGCGHSHQSMCASCRHSGRDIFGDYF